VRAAGAHPRTLPVVTGAARRTSGRLEASERLFCFLARDDCRPLKQRQWLSQTRIQRAARRSWTFFFWRLFLDFERTKSKSSFIIAPFSSFLFRFFLQTDCQGSKMQFFVFV
jgi:hypothetical protein